jgi:hypothetical protein
MLPGTRALPDDNIHHVHRQHTADADGLPHGGVGSLDLRLPQRVPLRLAQIHHLLGAQLTAPARRGRHVPDHPD